MLNSALLKDPAITSLIRKMAPGDVVFKQASLGNTMFIIVEGVVKIVSQVGSIERLIALPGAGEILGERAILSPKAYRRNFTAQAKTPCILLEIDAVTLKTVLGKVPDFHLMILGLVLARLDKANFLVRILQITDPVDRLAQYLMYFSKYHCRKLPDGTETGITADEICQATNLDRHIVEECLQELASRGILSLRTWGYALENGDALLNYIPTLKYMMAA